MKYALLYLLPIILYSCREDTSNVTAMEGKVLPTCTIQLSDSVRFINTADIPTGKPIVLFIFSPYCAICRAQLADILQNKEILANTRLYLLTDAPYQDMKVFYDYFKLQNYPGVTVGSDSTHFWERYFNVPGVPYMAIYNPTKRLKQIIIGKSSANAIENIAFE
ncbi:MAG: hypothetical protein P4L51_23565 [Puia sp.]|nr:hypothetical protein [Puia sp.]